MKLYTKTGDGGDTGLVGGKRVRKNSPRITAIGEIDELNALLGVVRTATNHPHLEHMLDNVQAWLFEVGAELASPGEERFQTIGAEETRRLEESIDEQSDELPELRNFILPGGSSAAAYLHLARSVCRRAERRLLDLNEREPIREELRVFLNRLADWLFVSARTANRAANVDDVNWNRGSKT